MKIRFLYEDGSVPVVEVSSAGNEESEGMKDAKSLDGLEGSADSSVDTSSVVDSGIGGDSSASAGSSTPLAPDPAGTSQLGDASAMVDSSEVTDESEVEDTSEVTGDASMSDDRLLLDTPLDTYTVTEGLLLLAVVFLALGGAIALFRGR